MPPTLTLRPRFHAIASSSNPFHPQTLPPLSQIQPNTPTSCTSSPPIHNNNPNIILSPAPTHQIRHATLIRRPKRPYTFTQLVYLSDGSTYTHRTTSPAPTYLSTKDVRNAPLWNPTSKRLLDIERDEAGKLKRFREKFGRGFDVVKSPAQAAITSSAAVEVAAEGDGGDGGADGKAEGGRGDVDAVKDRLAAERGVGDTAATLTPTAAGTGAPRVIGEATGEIASDNVRENLRIDEKKQEVVKEEVVGEGAGYDNLMDLISPEWRTKLGEGEGQRGRGGRRKRFGSGGGGAGAGGKAGGKGKKGKK